jgi:hypothetical protein
MQDSAAKRCVSNNNLGVGLDFSQQQCLVEMWTKEDWLKL